MGISVAEYLGQRTDVETPNVTPASTPIPSCPFMGKECMKLKVNNRPICSVRRTDDTLWIVCKHRLCATEKSSPLVNYQQERLLEVARAIFDPAITADEVAVKREVTMPVVEGSRYNADYVMMRLDAATRRFAGPKKVVLEMQGGGETSNTGRITRHVEAWEADDLGDNALLRKDVKGAGTIVTNAWRRQQEQFIVKGNISMQTGGGMVFCVGSLLFDYLASRIEGHRLTDLRRHNWSLALLGFVEDTASAPAPGPIPLKIDEDRTLFTSYSAFLQILINQGGPHPELFTGDFEDLTGKRFQVE